MTAIMFRKGIVVYKIDNQRYDYNDPFGFRLYKATDKKRTIWVKTKHFSKSRSFRAAYRILAKKAGNL